MSLSHHWVQTVWYWHSFAAAYDEEELGTDEKIRVQFFISIRLWLRLRSVCFRLSKEAK